MLTHYLEAPFYLAKSNIYPQMAMRGHFWEGWEISDRGSESWLWVGNWKTESSFLKNVSKLPDQTLATLPIKWGQCLSVFLRTIFRIGLLAKWMHTHIRKQQLGKHYQLLYSTTVNLNYSFKIRNQCISKEFANVLCIYFFQFLYFWDIDFNSNHHRVGFIWFTWVPHENTTISVQ